MISKLTSWIFKVVGITPSGSKYDKYLILLPLSVSFCSMYHSLTSNYHKSTWLVAGDACLTVGFTQFLLFNVFSSNNYTLILKELAKIENELQYIGAVGSVRESRSVRLRLVTPLVQYLIVLVGFLLCPDVTVITKALIIDVLYAMPFLQYMMLVNSVEAMFAALNAHLQRIAVSADKTLLAIVSSRLDSVFRVHSSLHVVVNDINCLYWFYLLLVLGFRVFVIVYFLVWVLNDITSLEDTALLITLLNQVVMLVPPMGFCHFCSKEANRTAYIAHRILQADTHPRLWDEVGRFSRLTVDNKVEFSVRGIYTMNLNLITKMVTAVFTYVTIAIQLRDVNLFGPNTTTVSPAMGNVTRG